MCGICIDTSVRHAYYDVIIISHQVTHVDKLFLLNSKQNFVIKGRLWTLALEFEFYFSQDFSIDFCDFLDDFISLLMV